MPAAPDSAGFSVATHLTRHPYFHNMDDDALAALGAAALKRKFQAGDLIFMEGEPTSGLWIIERGRVKIFKLHVEGREHILHLLGPGDSFNDVSAFDGGPNPANAAALSDVTAWVLPSERLYDILREHPEMALHVIRGMSARLRGAVQQIEDLALYSVQARLSRFLLSRASDPSLQGPGITRAAIAAHLATTPETVSRVLRSLEEAGAIRFDRHRIVIVDEDLLQGLAYV